MRKTSTLIGLLSLLFVYNFASAQTFCTNNNGLLSPAITNSWNTITVTGGYYEFNATLGCDYSFTYCSNGGNAFNDSYLTVTDVADNPFNWNDDWCGLSSELTWTCPATGTYRIHLGECCGGTSLCSFPAQTLAYFSSCSACPGTPPVEPLSADVENCGPANFTLTADQNGATNSMTVWYEAGNPVALDTTYTATSTLNVSVTATNTYFIVNIDTLSGCSSNAVYIDAVINPIPTIYFNGVDSVYCNTTGAVEMNIFPNGGTATGTGVIGTQFDATVAGLGVHQINYDYTNPITGCSNSDSVMVTVAAPSPDPNYSVCDGTTVTIPSVGSAIYEWYDMSQGGNLLGTGNSLTVNNILSDSTFYYHTSSMDNFKIDTLLSANAIWVDHDSETGDDRGGIAITNDYIFMVGDDATVRYDFPTLTNPFVGPMRDGIFSDLGTGILWSFYNGTSDPDGSNISGYSISSIITLNDDLTLGSTIVNLSQAINVEYNSGVFAGTGYVLLHNSLDNNMYKIDLSNGLVTLLGNFAPLPNYTSSENWAYWGVAEFMNNEYSVVYSTGYNTDAVVRYNLSTLTSETVSQFSNFGDVASIAYSPLTSKWAYHTEGSTDHAPGGEDLVILDGTHFFQNGGAGCRSEVTVKIAPALAVSSNITTPTCIGMSDGVLDLVIVDGAYPLTYAWSNGATVEDLTGLAAGTYTVDLVDDCGTTGSFNIVVNDPAPTVANAGPDVAILNGGFTNLTGSGGVTASWSPSTGLDNPNSFTPIAFPTVTTTYVLTVTNAMGCTDTDSVTVFISGLGIDENSAETTIEIYPNPSKGNVSIDLTGLTKDNAKSFAVVDAFGKVIVNYSNVKNEIITLKKDQLASGVYSVVFTIDGQQITKRLVILD
jgi:hypothetical protein